MKINKLYNISFKENELSREMNSKNAILMLRDPNASIKFQQNKEMAKNADAVSSNPIKAVGYKLYKTFSIMKEDSTENTEVSKENHINYVA